MTRILLILLLACSCTGCLTTRALIFGDNKFVRKIEAINYVAAIGDGACYLGSLYALDKGYLQYQGYYANKTAEIGLGLFIALDGFMIFAAVDYFLAKSIAPRAFKEHKKVEVDTQSND